MQTLCLVSFLNPDSPSIEWMTSLINLLITWTVLVWEDIEELKIRWFLSFHICHSAMPNSKPQNFFLELGWLHRRLFGAFLRLLTVAHLVKIQILDLIRSNLNP
jgi:hypothetical protein